MTGFLIYTLLCVALGILIGTWLTLAAIRKW